MRHASRTIRQADVSAMLTLVNDLHELPAGDAARRNGHFLERVCGLLEAKVGLIGFLRDAGSTWQYTAIPLVEFGWPSASDRAAVMAYHDDAARDPQKYADLMQSILSIPRRVVTRRRADLHDDATWYAAANVNEHRHPGRIDDCIYSVNRFAPGWLACIGVHREWGDPVRFGPREAAILQLVNEHAEFLWRASVSDQPAHANDYHGSLSPRLRQTRDLLLRGLSEKEVARRLEVSRNTLHKYVTALYRRFGVNSRAEFMALQKSQNPDVAGALNSCNVSRVN